MPTEIIFDQPINTSAQVWDTAFYADESSITNVGGFSTAPNLSVLGEITSVSVDRTIVKVDTNIVPSDNSFFTFQKDKTVNTSKLTGYYAEIKFKNNGTEKADLFMVNSEVSISSK